MPLKYPSDRTRLNIQVFDNDILSHDDFICGADINIGTMVRDLYYLNIPMKFDLNYFEDLAKENPSLKEDIYFPDKNERTNFWVKCYRFEGVN